MPIIEGGYGPFMYAGNPTGTGTNEVQTLTITGTPTSGQIELSYELQWALVTWSNVNATLITAIQTALNSISTIGSGNTVVAVGTMTAGVGTATITFVNAKAAQPVNLLGCGPMLNGGATAAITETTPGAPAGGVGAPKGALLIDTANGKLYINTGTATIPTWTVVGTQT